MLKKFLIILTVFSFTSAANAVGLNIGVSGVAGGVEATGTETEATGKEERTAPITFMPWSSRNLQKCEIR